MGEKIHVDIVCVLAQCCNASVHDNRSSGTSVASSAAKMQIVSDGVCNRVHHVSATSI